MVMTTGIVPVRFYQVREEGITLANVSEKFRVATDKIERENPDKEAPLAKGEMLFIQQH